MGTIRDMSMFMLYLVGAYLLLKNYTGFNAMLNAVGTNWRQTLLVLQGDPGRTA